MSNVNKYAKIDIIINTTKSQSKNLQVNIQTYENRYYTSMKIWIVFIFF